MLNPANFKISAPKIKKERNNILLDGNEAIALGAITAGCQYFSAYPITPATQIGEYLSKIILKYMGYVYQAEDEIAALASAIGASFSGVKSMTATSGPGLSLMQELIGLTSMIEIPVVIVDVQRVGPSTGMPTKYEQSDLFAAVFGGHGEGPRIILSSTNVQDNFKLTIKAFNLSEQYQCPVILLSDIAISNTVQTVHIKNFEQIELINRKIVDNTVMANDDIYSEYARYQNTESGISSLLVPGISSIAYRATSVEHDENSYPDHSPENRSLQMEKRFKKLDNLVKDHSDLYEVDFSDITDYGEVDFAIISWGFTASVVKETVNKLRFDGYKISSLYPRLIYPLCQEVIEKIALQTGILFIPETNFFGQYSRLIRMYTTIKPIQINNYGGEPFSPQELYNEIINHLKNVHK